MFDKVVNFGASFLTLPKAPTAPKLKKQDSVKLPSNSQTQDADESASQLTIPIIASDSFKENKPPAPTVKAARGKTTQATVNGAGPAKAHDAAPAAELKPPTAPAQQQISAQPPSSEIQPHRGLRAPSPSAAACRPQPQPAAKLQAASGSRPPSRQNSSGGIPRTGDEIWAANLQLGRLAEQFADPEDAKPKKRRGKSPSLQEKLHKHWCGTYGDKLAREHAHLDVEEPPAPKYEPPSFLKDSDSDSDGDDGDACETSPPSSDPAPAVQPAAGPRAPAPGAQRAPKAAAPDIIVMSHSPSHDPTGPASSLASAPTAERGAAAATATAAVKTSGKRAAGGGGKKQAAKQIAAASAAANSQLATGPEAADDVAATGKPYDAVSDRMEDEAAGVGGTTMAGKQASPAPARRAHARKLKGGEAGAKETKSRPAAKRRVKAQEAAPPAAATPPPAELIRRAEDGGPTEPQSLQNRPPSLQQQHRVADDAGTGPGPATKGHRDRKSHLPASVSFGGLRSVVPPHSSCSASQGGPEGVAGSEPQQGPAGGVATATKRSRDGTTGGLCEDKGRVHKVGRLEQQQAKDIEVLRQRLADMESKNKELELKSKEQSEFVRQLQSEAKAAERRAQQAEKDRAREVGENERLRTELNSVKELKALKSREGKERKQVEGMLQDWMRQIEQMQKGWQRS